MKWLHKVFKGGREKTTTFLDGNALLGSLIDNRSNNRIKAATALNKQGITSLCGLTPEGVAHAYAGASMLIMPVDAQAPAVILRELLLRLFFCRTLLDDDQVVRTQLSHFLRNFARSWAQRQIVNLNVKGHGALKELGLTGPAVISSAGNLSVHVKDLQLILQSTPLTEKQNCVKCRKPLIVVENIWALPEKFDFSEAVVQAAAVLSTPGYICRKCGSVICKGCLSVEKSDNLCPKCGDREMIHWSEM